MALREQHPPWKVLQLFNSSFTTALAAGIISALFTEDPTPKCKFMLDEGKKNSRRDFVCALAALVTFRAALW